MRHRFHDQTGSVTLVALCLTTVLAIALGSYIALCQRSYDLSTQLLHEDKVRQLAQTGLEEALWALNQNSWTGSGPAGDVAWTTRGANRTIVLAYGSLGQGATGQIALTVANFAGTGPVWPAITSTATLTLGDGRVFTKTLQATTGPAPLFGNAIASVNSYVSFTSQGTVDSWNSNPDGNPATPVVAYSFTAGNAANYAAVIAANDSGTTSIALNQALVYGYLATNGQPVSYSTSGSPPGSVKGPGTAATVAVEPGRLGKSAFIPASAVFTVNTPALVPGSFTLFSWLAALLTIGPADNAIYSAPAGFAMPTGLLGYTLNIARPVKMVVNGDFVIGSGLLGPAQIVVQSPNGSLAVFVSGNVAIGGGGVVNQTNDPRKVAFFCTNGSTTGSVQYTSTADFCGVIYSENMPIDIQQNATFYGALLSGQYVSFSAGATNPQFHYDTALRHALFADVTTPYVILLLTES
ncbi:hypothetical protein [Opitutus sp. GAS368]|uniref:DUF7305 domain-containing protein n=1 Tax=Opitutus sp. GAS368 TaxID=1882749 RepID=UPI00087DCDB4|nr:hypothetical protein [Opitutus sp. GAS368]SDS05535.1 hypothetical protein SAMN05444173_1753 [Opitutus sp. GAS368]